MLWSFGVLPARTHSYTASALICSPCISLMDITRPPISQPPFFNVLWPTHVSVITEQIKLVKMSKRDTRKEGAKESERVIVRARKCE